MEDNPSSRRALEILFKRRGYDVIQADSVQAGIIKIDDTPDWIILDLMLPDGNGITILNVVRERGLPIKVAVTTGMHPADVHFTYKPNLLLQKPLAGDILKRLLEAVSG